MNSYFTLKNYLILKTELLKLQSFIDAHSWLGLTGHIIGMIGMICVVIAYYGLEKGYYSRDHLGYYIINLTGAILLMISLMIHFNLGSFIIEIFWIVISLQGLMRVLKQRRR